MTEKVDLRVVKTQRLLKDSFLLLVNEKGFEHVTINDIVTKAQVNRSTFYLHYADKYALLEALVAEETQKLVRIVSSKAISSAGSSPVSALKVRIELILQTIAEHVLFYQAVLGRHGMFDVRTKILLSLRGWLDEFVVGKSLIERTLLLDLLAAFYVEAITWWVNHDLCYTPEYLADQLVTFLVKGPAVVAGAATPGQFLADR